MVDSPELCNEGLEWGVGSPEGEGEGEKEEKKEAMWPLSCVLDI